MEKGSPLLINILLGLLGLSVGFGISQLSLAQVVHVTAANQTNIQKELNDVRAEWRGEFIDEKNRSDARTFEIGKLVTSALAAQSEQTRLVTQVITLIEVQKQIKP